MLIEPEMHVLAECEDVVQVLAAFHYNFSSFAKFWRGLQICLIVLFVSLFRLLMLWSFDTPRLVIWPLQVVGERLERHVSVTLLCGLARNFIPASHIQLVCPLARMKTL